MNSSSFIVSFDVFCNQGLVFQNERFQWQQVRGHLIKLKGILRYQNTIDFL